MRTVEDRLREEYFDLLPNIRRTTEELEAEVRYLLIGTTRNLEKHEKLVVRSRVKDCESAIDSLRRRQESWDLDPSNPGKYSLKRLNDLAGVRVLAFPYARLIEVDRLLRARFPDWTSDPVPPVSGTRHSLAFKYHGYCVGRSDVRGEVQAISMLVGLFWEVEHAALYKPARHLAGIGLSHRMRDTNADVIRALHAFDAQFEELTSFERTESAQLAAH
ncbi:MAG: hypothetical protein WDO56_36365 [Gammaproteobacteria bacterium]